MFDASLPNGGERVRMHECFATTGRLPSVVGQDYLPVLSNARAALRKQCLGSTCGPAPLQSVSGIGNI